MSATRIMLLVLALVAATSLDLQAQMCFSGRPLPKCKAFMLTEFGYSRRLNDSHRDVYSGRWYLTAELGAMVNRGYRSALGAALFFGAEDDGSRWGLRPRYRRWLSGTISLDVAPGILFAGTDNRFQPSFPGFSGQLSLGVGDLVGVTTQLEIIPSDALGTRTEWFVGVRGGSGIGIVGGLATFVLAAIAAATAF
jgi:hypothetical protein